MSTGAGSFSPPRPASPPFRSALGISQAVVWLAGIAASLSAVTIVVAGYQYFLTGRFLTAHTGQLDALADRYDTITVAAAFPVILLLTTTAGLGICFIVWFRRSYRNLPALGISPLRHKPGWAVGGWFVPILQFFRPKSIMDEIWRGSSVAAVGRQPYASVEPVPGRLHAWWGAFLLSLLLTRVYAALSRGMADDLTAWVARERLLHTVDIAAEVLSLAAAVLLIGIVRDTTRFQEDAAASVRSPGQPR